MIKVRRSWWRYRQVWWISVRRCGRHACQCIVAATVWWLNYCCGRWWTCVSGRRTTMLWFYWQWCVWFHWMIITAHTETIRWWWCLCATSYFAWRTRIVFAVCLICMSWRFFAETSVNLYKSKIEISGICQECTNFLIFFLSIFIIISSTRESKSLTTTTNITYLHVLTQRWRMCIWLIATSNAAIVRFVRCVNVWVFLSVRWIGKTSIASFVLTFEWFFAWKLNKNKSENC